MCANDVRQRNAMCRNVSGGNGDERNALCSEKCCNTTGFAHGERCEASESRCISKVSRACLEQTAGRRLSDELSRDGDSITVRELIGHAARFADMIERCDELIQGSGRRGCVRTNSDQVLEVRISDPVRERRQLTTGCDICSVRFISRGRDSDGARDDDVLDDGD